MILVAAYYSLVYNLFVNKKHKLFILGAVFLIVAQILFTPAMALAKKSEKDLNTAAQTYTKLTAFARCSAEYLTTDGIDDSDGPFNIPFVFGKYTGGEVPNVAIGHHVQNDRGRFDCASADGSREDLWFKLLGYSGWSSGDNSYKKASNGNIKRFKDSLYFVKDKNSSSALEGNAAKQKLRGQIQAKLDKLIGDFSNEERIALKVHILYYGFKIGCGAYEGDENDPGDKVNLNGTTWIVGNDGQGASSGAISVGFGTYAGGDDGEMSCGEIVKAIQKDQDIYNKVLGAKAGQDVIPDVSGDANTTGGNVKFECSVSANPITWIMCALIEGFAEAVDKLDAQVTDMLNIKTEDYFGSDVTGDSFKQIWSATRTISVGFLIIMVLIMIISTAIGAGPFDAYTVKKIMPRILAVVVLISISWPLVKFCIEMSNLMGFAVRGLIQAPFLNSGAISLDGGQSTIGATALVSSGIVLGLPGLLSFIVTAFGAVMIAFITLILRQILVILLAVTVPIALVSFVLPNTSKAGKFWWDAFSKALLVFPIISAFIAMGRIFAVVAYNSAPGGDNAGTLRVFIAFIAYFAPYFLIPQAFKMAGGLLGNLSGMVNDRSRGAFDRLKNFRKTQSSNNMHKMKTGDRFQGRNAVARQFNTRTSGLAGGWRGSHLGFGARGEAYHDIHQRQAAQDAIKNNPLLQQLAFDDSGNAVMALSGGTAAGAERASRILAEANDWTETERLRALNSAAAIGFNNSNALGAVQTMGQNKSRALTGVLGGEAGMALVRDSVTAASGGNEQLVGNTMGNFAFNSRNAGRYDFGGEAAGESLAAGWGRASVAQHAQSHTTSLQAFGDDFVNTLQDANSTQEQRNAATIALMEMQTMLPNATAENQAVINETLARAGIDHSATHVEMVQRRNNDGSPMLDANNNPMYGQVATAISVEDQLANISGPNGLTVRDIRGQARTYDSQTPQGAMAADGAPAAPPPPAQP